MDLQVERRTRRSDVHFEGRKAAAKRLLSQPRLGPENHRVHDPSGHEGEQPRDDERAGER